MHQHDRHCFADVHVSLPGKPPKHFLVKLIEFKPPKKYLKQTNKQKPIYPICSQLLDTNTIHVFFSPQLHNFVIFEKVVCQTYKFVFFSFFFFSQGNPNGLIRISRRRFQKYYRNITRDLTFWWKCFLIHQQSVKCCVVLQSNDLKVHDLKFADMLPPYSCFIPSLFHI